MFAGGKVPRGSFSQRLRALHFFRQDYRTSNAIWLLPFPQELFGALPKAGEPALRRTAMKTAERGSTFVLVLALHVGAVAWATHALDQSRSELVQPTMQGVLVPSDAVVPPTPAPLAPPPPVPDPEPPKPEPPKPSPPKPKPEPKRKPLPPPPPLPPSETAIEIPMDEAEPPPAPQASKAPSEDAPPQPHRPPPPGQAGPTTETPLTPPRVDASHLNNPAPTYPPLSRRMREEGRVLLDVHIMPDGSVAEVKLRESSGHRRLDDSAIAAVERWRYVPATRGGKPIAFWYVQPVIFSLLN
ncbi:energy transducer TonB [Thauera sp. 27]|nr:energy transducer TonB [Thauera sp. 27]